ncbi:uncharacterized protein K489DRAFT_255090 [Dissoconium aciculare CBS 342.82]|uniref:Uncharacterized protein n=1 Tax=Dissoconium aciculare CBS 342.82 TaxID=1314786 RepID=A0A6J3M118_9PEZI|nr:uncharacterized protein K489DRAFT_255090 [Dissoconium aciculare CBS 342.82]KAF1821730.1 hypothetical protein K489DRAFT_255090 [Dissoconium aciculare CBS 342.82]
MVRSPRTRQRCDTFCTLHHSWLLVALSCLKPAPIRSPAALCPLHAPQAIIAAPAVMPPRLPARQAVAEDRPPWMPSMRRRMFHLQTALCHFRASLVPRRIQWQRAIAFALPTGVF